LRFLCIFAPLRWVLGFKNDRPEGSVIMLVVGALFLYHHASNNK